MKARGVVDRAMIDVDQGRISLTFFNGGQGMYFAPSIPNETSPGAIPGAILGAMHEARALPGKSIVVDGDEGPYCANSHTCQDMNYGREIVRIHDPVRGVA